MTEALTKPVRVIKELTRTEQFIRKLENITKLRNDALARLDADYVERIEEARSLYLTKSDDQHPSATADSTATAEAVSA